MAFGDKSRRYVEERERADEEPVSDPVAEAAAPAIALSFEQLKELLGTRSEGLNQADLVKAVAEGAAKARKPENPVHPGISVFSHPEGEEANPKAKLKCRMFIGGGPIEQGTVTPTEIAALNAMTPGFYRIKRADESETVIEVRGQVNANKELERLWIVINSEDPDRNGFGTLTRMVTQFTEANRVQTVAA